ncbi:hypothetical protein ACTXT7_004497 [Hymenolepis weldensis]
MSVIPMDVLSTDNYVLLTPSYDMERNPVYFMEMKSRSRCTPSWGISVRGERWKVKTKVLVEKLQEPKERQKFKHRMLPKLIKQHLLE